MNISSYKKGIWAEYLCILYLFLKGYKILAHRYKTKLGEIDIIAQKNEMVIFIEVKARADIKTAADAISSKSMKRIENTAKIWLAQTKYNIVNCRFDVFLVTSLLKKPIWYKNAWQMA